MVEDDVIEHVGISTENIGSVFERPMRKAWRPNISKHPLAFADGKFLPVPGDTIIIQYPDVWRDTCIWTIERIDDATGNVVMVIPNATYHGMTNIFTGPERGQEIRFYNPKMKLEVGVKSDKKEKPEKAKIFDSSGNEVKRKRGRPAKVKDAPVTELQNTPE